MKSLIEKANYFVETDKKVGGKKLKREVIAKWAKEWSKKNKQEKSDFNATGYARRAAKAYWGIPNFSDFNTKQDGFLINFIEYFTDALGLEK